MGALPLTGTVFVGKKPCHRPVIEIRLHDLSASLSQIRFIQLSTVRLLLIGLNVAFSIFSHCGIAHL
jgi:hypothetical protein